MQFKISDLLFGLKEILKIIEDEAKLYPEFAQKISALIEKTPQKNQIKPEKEPSIFVLYQKYGENFNDYLNRLNDEEIIKIIVKNKISSKKKIVNLSREKMLEQIFLSIKASLEKGNLFNLPRSEP